jgi:hypothetical protein
MARLPFRYAEQMNNQPAARGHAPDSSAAHRTVQISNRANLDLILKNRRRLVIAPEPQPNVSSIGLEVAKKIEILEYQPIDGSIPFAILVDGEQIWMAMGDERDYNLLQALIAIADQETSSDD